MLFLCIIMWTIKNKQKHIPGICGCVWAHNPRWLLNLESQPSLWRKIGPSLIPAEVHSYRHRPGRAGDFSLNSRGLEKRATRGAGDPAGVGPASAQRSQRQAFPRPPWAPPHSGPAPNSAACISHEPLRLPLFGEEVAFCTGAAVKTRIAAGSHCWTKAGGGTSVPSGVRQAGGGSAAGAGRL